MLLARRVARETTVVAGGQLAAIATNFAGTVIVTRALGPDDRGIYAWLLALAGLGIQIAALAPVPAVRAAVKATGQPAGLAPALALLGLAGSVLALPVLAYALGASGIGEAARPFVASAALAVPLWAVALGLQGLLFAEGRPGAVAAAQLVPRVLLVAAIVALERAGALDLRAAILLFPATAAVELAVTLLGVGAAPFRDRPRLPPGAAGRLGSGWAASVSLFLFPRIGLLALAASAPADLVGQYSVALTLTEVAGVPATALGGVLLSRAGAVSPGAAAGLLGGAALGCGAAALLAPVVVPTLFGAAFGPAADLLRPLLLSVLLLAAFQLRQPALHASGTPARVALPGALACLAAGAVAAAAVPALGPWGAILSHLAGAATLAGVAATLPTRRR